MVREISKFCYHARICFAKRNELPCIDLLRNLSLKQVFKWDELDDINET